MQRTTVRINEHSVISETLQYLHSVSGTHYEILSVTSDSDGQNPNFLRLYWYRVPFSRAL